MSLDPEVTRALGRSLGGAAEAGTVVALIGDLGSGKTVFARGVGEGLGVPDVRSPTFVLIQRHDSGRLPLWHADLYRLGEAGELEQLGLEEAFEGGVLLVEWADRFPEVLPADHLEVRFVELEGGRALALRALGPRHEGLVRALASAPTGG